MSSHLVRSVMTDKQTDAQTHRQTERLFKKEKKKKTWATPQCSERSWYIMSSHKLTHHNALMHKNTAIKREYMKLYYRKSLAPILLKCCLKFKKFVSFVSASNNPKASSKTWYIFKVQQAAQTGWFKITTRQCQRGKIESTTSKTTGNCQFEFCSEQGSMIVWKYIE